MSNSPKYKEIILWNQQAEARQKPISYQLYRQHPYNSTQLTIRVLLHTIMQQEHSLFMSTNTYHCQSPISKLAILFLGKCFNFSNIVTSMSWGGFFFLLFYGKSMSFNSCGSALMNNKKQSIFYDNTRQSIHMSIFKITSTYKCHTSCLLHK